MLLSFLLSFGSASGTLFLTSVPPPLVHIPRLMALSLVTNPFFFAVKR